MANEQRVSYGSFIRPAAGPDSTDLTLDSPQFGEVSCGSWDGKNHLYAKGVTCANARTLMTARFQIPSVAFLGFTWNCGGAQDGLAICEVGQTSVFDPAVLRALHTRVVPIGGAKTPTT